MSAMKIAVTLYTVSSRMKTPEACVETLKRVKQIGYTNVETGLPFPCADFGTMMLDAGFSIIDMHVGLDEFQKRFDATVALARQLKCAHLTIPWMDPQKMNSALAWRTLAQELSSLGKRLAGEGIILQYHNHHFEFARFEGKTGLEILYAESDPKYLKAQLDTHWVTRGGGDPVAWIRAMQGRAEQIHFKDMVIQNTTKGTNPVFADVGSGNLNWPEILKACRDVGIQDCIVEEDPGEHMPDPFKSIANSLAFLKKMGLESPAQR
ncbi:MAG: sugar phosphate isomerase/epimerase [Kiritimatiellaeota bacterium]|nr:sugar phosphate isomerase/epimerase [Kiritimatiellota bacterium]